MARKLSPVWLSSLLLVACSAGCGSSSDEGDSQQSGKEKDSRATIEVTSSAFSEGQPIPKRHTGDGEDVSPPLTWSGVPADTKQLALICDDPDAPTDEPWVHWVIYGIPPIVSALPEGIPTTPELNEPAGAKQGNNSWPSVGYRGPAPPEGDGVHHYHFKIFALSAELDVQPGIEKNELLEKMSGKILATGELVGTYER